MPHGLIVGREALFVSYAPDRAGPLLACAAAGMLAGDTVVGRFVPARLRSRLAAPLQALPAAPHLLFAVGAGPSVAVAAAAVAVSAVGYGASLLYQVCLPRHGASLAVTAVLTAGLSSAAPPSPRTARRRTA
ncbi:hypothetical protein [Streptomyces omiyaensis]|uniref:Uncharacterized protein n=1 Tax=Streptomyces omiyaensis TaxID=68247 RepID=A0ABW7C273_9ACTN|nr:hypothetical protein GCM10010363_20330 [Streptomyces omiyaensis]